MEILIESSTVSNKYLYAFQTQTNQAVLSKQTTTPIIKETNFSKMIHRWGDDNLFPNKIYQSAKDNTIIPFLYSQIQSIDGNETTVIENGEVKIIDTFGNCVKDCPEDEPKVFYDFEN